MLPIMCVSCGSIGGYLTPITRETLIAMALGTPYARMTHLLSPVFVQTVALSLPFVCVSCFQGVYYDGEEKREKGIEETGPKGTNPPSRDRVIGKVSLGRTKSDNG